MKILKIFLLFIFLWLQYSLWLGKNGVIDYIKIYNKVIKEKKTNADLDIRNNQIMSEIENLNHINDIKHNDI
ncbi:cell division protein FtsB [Buchnera aphidicola (Brachycaudus cardui)]|uniref:Cell division protein FtsB n=1 Tax=Buchnera aphidicola (Brachycaudus cardui) TaxID=557993 RepID=A0A4D6XSG2_9GAMM|nr:septum formation initiator family protein [Buchnera aphidicola]QCI20552.1 cell division protein FtsB [Buchnera aphidicola (Brachycaudus cardui)]